MVIVSSKSMDPDMSETPSADQYKPQNHEFKHHTLFYNLSSFLLVCSMMPSQDARFSTNSSPLSICISPLLPSLSSLCNLDLQFNISKTPWSPFGKNSICGV